MKSTNCRAPARTFITFVALLRANGFRCRGPRQTTAFLEAVTPARSTRARGYIRQAGAGDPGAPPPEASRHL